MGKLRWSVDKNSSAVNILSLKGEVEGKDSLLYLFLVLYYLLHCCLLVCFYEFIVGTYNWKVVFLLVGK